MIEGLSLIEKEITAFIREELDKVGVLYRVFSRTKDKQSITEKISRKATEGIPYAIDERLIQDLIGIRIVTYFRDDVDIVYSILSSKMKFHDEEIDNHDLTVFKPKRNNIICKLGKDHSKTLKDIQHVSNFEEYKLFDNTFELQLRTILSEGWHEIDHSLRYKCKDDWKDHPENERMLNGIYANLETNDIALRGLFDELAYKHYKNQNWEGVLRNKFRLKFQLVPLDERITQILNDDLELGKQILRSDRKDLLHKISALDIHLPLTQSNIIYVLNLFFIHNASITGITPQYILDQ